MKMPSTLLGGLLWHLIRKKKIQVRKVKDSVGEKMFTGNECPSTRFATEDGRVMLAMPMASWGPSHVSTRRKVCGITFGPTRLREIKTFVY